MVVNFEDVLDEEETEVFNNKNDVKHNSFVDLLKLKRVSLHGYTMNNNKQLATNPLMLVFKASGWWLTFSFQLDWWEKCCN